MTEDTNFDAQVRQRELQRIASEIERNHAERDRLQRSPWHSRLTYFMAVSAAAVFIAALVALTAYLSLSITDRTTDLSERLQKSEKGPPDLDNELEPLIREQRMLARQLEDQRAQLQQLAREREEMVTRLEERSAGRDYALEGLAREREEMAAQLKASEAIERARDLEIDQLVKILTNQERQLEAVQHEQQTLTAQPTVEQARAAQKALEEVVAQKKQGTAVKQAELEGAVEKAHKSLTAVRDKLQQVSAAMGAE
jgi:hypothetical protein